MNPQSSHRGGNRQGSSRRGLLGAIAGGAAAIAIGGYAVERSHSGGGHDDAAPSGSASPDGATSSAAPTGGYRFERLSSPGRTLVRGADNNVLATFTDGARTAVLTGPARTWREPRTTSAVVGHNAWVRLMPAEWHQGKETGDWFRGWFPKALADTSPDVLAIAFQYGDGSPDHTRANGLRYAGDAAFGPKVPGESQTSFHYRDEKSDFYDYLGIPWTFSDGTRKTPETARYGDVDCSGFMRLVWGYRSGYPMHATNAPGAGLPRRAYAIAAYAPGVLLIPDTKQQPTDLSVLQPGDLVFFAINIGKPLAIDHCGMYLGLDDRGHPRFYSSRSQANGPTMGDLAGVARLDGTGFYAEGLRVARRL
ncbi:NlpC/P60 family protein [Streptomyces sp. V4-01]|uniref:NlpC/P60 family protein n=1 Tax=Actinacidiphila polyblastidii TaxID=3110430 RepID=A0ABU7PL64_9ACTN|nr:NlpC/P60 family protein [Streptomyces sp. V4-01]